jgi:hypothetical protein
MEDLERLLDEAITGGMEEERSVQYAIKVLQTFRMEQQQREEDEKLYIQAFLAKQEDEEKNLRLEKEFMELQEKVFYIQVIVVVVAVVVVVVVVVVLNR